MGTGHPDTSSWEFKTNILRDTYSSLVGHPPLAAYLALAQNEPVAKVRAQLIRVSGAQRQLRSRVSIPSELLLNAAMPVLQKMIQPAGPPPPREGDEPRFNARQHED